MFHISEQPGERPFYKYATPEAALAILKARSVRYSSPLLFNDPFDVQSGLHFDFDLGTLHSKVVDRLHQLVEAPEEPPVDSEDAWGKALILARKHFPEYGFPHERWEEITSPLFNQILELMDQTQKGYQANWRDVLLPGIRVFCVSEEKDNLLMWAHYAGHHTGCVFEFWSLPDEDNPLSVASPVRYSDYPPTFFTEHEWIDNFMGIKKIDINTLYRQYANVKSSHWAYEHEWRVWYPFSKSTTKFDNVPIRQSELKALYLGCRATAAFCEEAIALLRNHYPAARVYRAEKRDDAYSLKYTEV
jgi:hypothetical protein